MGPAKPAKTLLDQRRISENPAIDSRMIDREAAFGDPVQVDKKLSIIKSPKSGNDGRLNVSLTRLR